jgi:probable rRNA maturation factor
MRYKVYFFSAIPGRKFPWQHIFEPLAQGILAGTAARRGCPARAVNIILCADAELRELNRKYRKLDKVTDVLSFVWNEPALLGEIYIAYGQVKKQAPLYGNTYCKELKRVLAHGMLHLCGYDHRNKNDRKIMREKEDFYLNPKPYCTLSNHTPLNVLKRQTSLPLTVT